MMSNFMHNIIMNNITFWWLKIELKILSAKKSFEFQGQINLILFYYVMLRGHHNGEEESK